jgi:hypothetical protein
MRPDGWLTDVQGSNRDESTCPATLMAGSVTNVSILTSDLIIEARFFYPDENLLQSLSIPVPEQRSAQTV